jgi:hypothetical protein
MYSKEVTSNKKFCDDNIADYHQYYFDFIRNTLSERIYISFYINSYF